MTTKWYFSVLMVFLLHSCEDGNDKEPAGPLSVVFEIRHVSVHGGNDGEVKTIIIGGIPPYVYNWSNGSDSTVLCDLAAGVYHLVLTDAEGNTLKDSVRVNQPDPLMLRMDVQHCSSSQSSDGSIDLTISGGVPPYSVLWSTGDTTEDMEGLSAGSYILTVRDLNQAKETDTVVIEEGFINCRDADGNDYGFVQIGSQVWMSENLKVTRAPDGTEIVSYCYGDDPANASVYGRLYTWDVAMNGSREEKAQGICPVGWHIPSDEEFKQLEIYLGMSRAAADSVNVWRGTDQGTKLKKRGSSGYEALLCGRRSSSGVYMLLDDYEYVWTSTEYRTANAWRRCIRAGSPDVGRWNTFPKTYAFSVRCIKDE